MFIGSFFRSLGHLFSGTNLTAAEKVVSSLLPEFGDALAAFSAKLPDEFDSLKALATEAQAVVKAAKGIDLSASMAIHLAQSVITAHWPEVVAEAEKLITTGKL
jgi:hypothetical protein